MSQDIKKKSKEEVSVPKDKKLQQWFEMKDLPSNIINRKVWVPLRAAKTLGTGRYGQLGYSEKFFGLNSVAFPTKMRKLVEKLSWMDAGLSRSYRGFHDGNKYVPVDVYIDHSNKIEGISLVLEQSDIDKREWHLHQDFVVTLRLAREGDNWVSPSEGYKEVARLHRDSKNIPELIEVRADHLTDYLCAREMGLYTTYYFSRRKCFEEAPNFDWDKELAKKKIALGKWEGSVREIHEGGFPYGEKIAVFHASRTDVDASEDIPDISGIPTDENVKSKTWEKGYKGKKLYAVTGELWGNGWLNPAKMSKRIKGDKTSPSIYFSIDEKGNKLRSDKLIGSGRWLWFKPDVAIALAHRRGGSLKWYTRDTGSISCSPGYNVHFGINQLGLINVYAKDIGLLPEWQQQIWVGHNISPEGGVSKELLASQVKALPAKTQSPEEFLELGIKTINYFSSKKIGFPFLRDHGEIPDILKRTHRFRALDNKSLYSLAKDLTRLFADSLDTKSIQKLKPPPKNTKWGSLTSLQHLLSTQVDKDHAKQIMTPFFRVYDLRLGDSHLPSTDIDESFSALGISKSTPTVYQGAQMISRVVSSMYEVIRLLKVWDVDKVS